MYIHLSSRLLFIYLLTLIVCYLNLAQSPSTFYLFSPYIFLLYSYFLFLSHILDFVSFLIFFRFFTRTRNVSKILARKARPPESMALFKFYPVPSKPAFYASEARSNKIIFVYIHRKQCNLALSTEASHLSHTRAIHHRAMSKAYLRYIRRPSMRLNLPKHFRGSQTHGDVDVGKIALNKKKRNGEKKLRATKETLTEQRRKIKRSTPRPICLGRGGRLYLELDTRAGKASFIVFSVYFLK